MENLNTIILAVTGFVIVLIAVFLVPLLLEVRRAVESLRMTTEQKLNPALDELQATLKNVRSITENVNAITGDVKQFSGAVHEVGNKINAVNAIIDAVSSSVVVRTLGMKAGISAAISYLIANLMKKGGRT